MATIALCKPLPNNEDRCSRAEKTEKMHVKCIPMPSLIFAQTLQFINRSSTAHAWWKKGPNGGFRGTNGILHLINHGLVTPFFDCIPFETAANDDDVVASFFNFGLSLGWRSEVCVVFYAKRDYVPCSQNLPRPSQYFWPFWLPLVCCSIGTATMKSVMISIIWWYNSNAFQISWRHVYSKSAFPALTSSDISLCWIRLLAFLFVRSSVTS